ncbi:concanavalin A-like lectin/glucanase [Trametopsis cervina]|nr:concanavalin A-like lectin/glucanase [Trametopsis cervina]
MLSSPSTASSASSSTDAISTPIPSIPTHSSSSSFRTHNTTTDLQLQSPKLIFFTDKNRSFDAVTSEERRDPLRTPDSSALGTLRAQIDKPFSPPASVINMRRRRDNVEPPTSTQPHLCELKPPLQLPPRTHPRRTPSTFTFRDSFMSPPTLPHRPTGSSGGMGMHEAHSRLSVSSLRSSMLSGPVEKPWVGERDVYGRVAYLVTYAVALLSVGGSVARCYTAWSDVPRVGGLCLVMQDDFERFDTEYTWTREVEMGGFGNGEFEMTTASSNSFVEDGKLYIVPTLTSDVIGCDRVLDAYTYNITGCTNNNLTACSAISNATSGTVMNPVMSARLTTRNSHHIQYGKVEIVAKLPTGDWLWPALCMLPVDDAYGPWPMSGEIDIMEAWGNGVEYKAQARDVFRGSLNWGPFTWLNGVSKTVEWTPTFIRIYVDTRLHHMLTVALDEPFFTRGQFPPFVANGSQTVQTPNPWANASKEGGNGGNAAPFDKPFYLIMNVAVGGTNGWFPDGVGDKPWLDGSNVAMSSFARQQAEWYATWPADPKERAMVVDSVKMWQAC